MTHSRRDRGMLGVAVVLVLSTAGLVAGTVLRAQRDGREALEDLQVAQAEQLAQSFDSRVTRLLDAFEGLATSPPAWNATLRDPSDAARLAQLQALNAQARTGLVIVDRAGIVTNGTLLRDPGVVGTPLRRRGLDGVLAGKASFLPVAPGLTTVLPTIGVAYPLRNASRAVIGAFLAESEVSVESAFTEEVSKLRRGRTGHFSFVDDTGVVVASSDPSLLARSLPRSILRGLDDRGVRRTGGRIVVVRTVPSVGWRTVFEQDVEEFEGALTGPLRNAMLFVVIAGSVAALVSFGALGRRLRRAREEQRRLEELNETREEFISIVSHELRTPVAGLMGFLQTALDHWEDMEEDERHRAMRRAFASARRLHSLTRDVLDTSSMESGGLSCSFTIVDLREEVASAVSGIRDVLPDRRFDVVVPDGPAWVRADPERLHQVLTNLLDNAVKSSPSLAPVEITVATSDDHVSVAVHDHGPGVGPEEIGKVFDKFVRGRTTTTGTGLGLYICRQIVDAHGGTISARSGDGGATFAFELPLMAAPAQHADV